MFLTDSLNTLKLYCENEIEPTLGELFAEADRIGTKYQDPEHVKEVAIELAELTKEILEKAGETTKTIAVKAVKIATSDKAIELYRQIAYVTALAVVMLICMAMAIGRMVLEHERTQTAIGAVKVKAVEISRFIRWRSVAFWEWVRSVLPSQSQRLLVMAGLVHFDLLD